MNNKANPKKSTRLKPIIRVFISSTFVDLKHERDALHNRVFPKLEQLCLKEGFQFQAIDMRWGVSMEAGLDHRTMRVCFGELRLAQEVSPEPNFLILLGNRYGWRPLPEDISVEEFLNLEELAEQDGIACQQQRPVDILRQWYRLDENSLTPIYVLQPRSKLSNSDLSDNDYTKVEAWNEVEKVLWHIINRMFPLEGLKDRFSLALRGSATLPAIIRFHASATEQEIWYGALNAPDASQHVLAFFREIKLPRNIVDAKKARDFFDIAFGEIDPVMQTALLDLKLTIKNKLGNNVVVLPAARLIPANNSGNPATVSTDHIDQLCHEVESRLTEIINRQIKKYWHETKTLDTSVEPSVDRTFRQLEIEQDEHLRFGNERGAREIFVGRKHELERILAYVENDSQLPLLIHGNSGCGKTAILARAYQETPAEKKPIIRFLGTTPRSSDVGSLLRNLCTELRLRNAFVEPLPSDVREIMEEFQMHLNMATVQQPLILFLDALDQLSDVDSGRQLFWVPVDPLPPHVKIIISCLSDRDENDPAGQPFVVIQRRQLPAENILGLDTLSIDDAKTLLFDRWLRKAGRSVTETQRHLIETRLNFASECRQPLYLKLLFEETKLWRSYYEPTELGKSVPELLDQVCKRLSKPENHGETLVRSVLGYIAASRHGLSETEILQVLFSDTDYKKELDEASQRYNHTLPKEPPRIPYAIWSRFRSDLAPYLTERAAPGGNVLMLYHPQIAEWAKARFVDAASWNPHSRLAEFFGRQDYFLEPLEEQRARSKQLPPTPRRSNVRKVDELPFQLLNARRHAELPSLLTALSFLEAKNEAGLLTDLADDFTECLQRLPSDDPVSVSLALIEQTLRQNLSFINAHLHHYPQALFQCLWNQCWWFDSAESARHYEGGLIPGQGRNANLHQMLERWRREKEERTPGFAWLRSLRPPPQHLDLGLQNVLQAPPFACFALSANGTLLASGPHQRVAANPNFEYYVKILDSRTGSQVTTFTTGEDYYSLAFSPDGRFVATGRFNEIRLWDALSGEQAFAFEAGSRSDFVGHERLLFSPDGGRLVAGLSGGAIYMWDMCDGRELAVRDDHQDDIQCLKFSPDGSLLISAASDHTIRLWDGVTAVPLATFGEPESSAHATQCYQCIAISPDGLQIASDGTDGSVRLWDLQSRSLITSFTGHREAVRSLAFSPDGRLLASGSEDHTVRLWDVTGEEQNHCWRGHTRGVTWVRFHPDGVLVFSGSADSTIRLWNVHHRRAEVELVDHSDLLDCVEFNPEGSLIATGARDNQAGLWDAETGERLAVLGPFNGWVSAIQFSPDGSKLAIGLNNSTIRVWDVATQVELTCLKGHTGGLMAVGFTPNGAQVVSGAHDWTMKRWDVASGACLEDRAGPWNGKEYVGRPDRFLPSEMYHNDTPFKLFDTNVQTWMPFQVDSRAFHAPNRTWAGTLNNYLVLLRLEGEIGNT